MSTENEIQLYVSSLPQKQMEIRQQLALVSPEKIIGKGLRQNNLTEMITAFHPSEVVSMAIISTDIFERDEPVIYDFSDFWTPISDEEARDRINNWKTFLSKGKKSVSEKSIPPNLMFNHNQWYLRKPVNITSHLGNLMASILETDKNEDWKLTVLQGLGPVVIAGTILKNIENENFKDRIFALLEDDQLLQSQINDELSHPDNIDEGLTLIHLTKLAEIEKTESEITDLADELKPEEINLDTLFKIDTTNITK